MKCNEVRKLLQEYLEGTLESATKKKLEDHIKECSSCKNELESIKKYFKSIRSIESIKAPDGFLRSVRKRIEETQKPKRIIPIRIKVPLELAGAVAAIAIAVIIFRNIFPEKKALMPQVALREIGEMAEKSPDTEQMVGKGEADISQKKAHDIETIAKKDTSNAISSQKEFKTQKELQTPEEFVTPRESETPEVPASPQETRKEEPVASLEKAAGDEARETTGAEKQAPVELVLLLPAERPESAMRSAKAEGIEPKSPTLDEDSLQRDAEKDKKPSSYMAEKAKIASPYEPSGYNYVSELEMLVKELGGMVVSTEYRKDGDILHFITIRIPREKTSEFMDGLKKLGKIEEKTPLEKALPSQGDTILFSIELSTEN